MRPRGAKPSPRHLLAAAAPHRPLGVAPSQVLYKPAQLSMWLNDVDGDCVTAEEAFAKACHSPEIFITDATVRQFATYHNVLNGAYLPQVMDMMEGWGFPQYKKVYGDGPHTSVDWTNPVILQNAVAQGPVKLGVAGDQLENVVPQQIVNGWFATGFHEDQNEDHCISLCGYGPAAWLADQLN